MFTDTELQTVKDSGTGEEKGDDAASVGRREQSSSSSVTDSAAVGQEQICVFVCGAVNNEGVYELSAGSRVIDAVNAAGGYSDEADRTYVNQAAYVSDTQKLEIPTLEEAAAYRLLEEESRRSAGNAGAGYADPQRVDLNTADMDALMKLPGIGENKAKSILAYRDEHGRFSSAEEIMNVSGIGSGVYEKMKDYIVVQ